ncbi:RagB/SusD family nutrient uptake outer membrane protein [Parapedobacter sp. SGR-10]|uniref:RagB/SusD family nutrient uptake outer membrane protein n=1 Tax=Parapedobacter sp. SGR-10 TaxID=2710879 RepID=UPI0013D3F12A|nr:RagB/SusD family nutrient uptake outer membrane protein [Parapedobacter sp. SGR-10]NGF58243.1 RagB/SusD family nutrient uptake outer membrane protein [Parapedobacter sp. SGR-10]
MKRLHIYYHFIILIVLVSLFPGCSKQLELAPPSKYNARDFYKTQQDFSLAIGGTYGGLRGIHSYQYPLVVESLSDNISTSTNNPYTRYTLDASDPNVLSLWSAYWTIIDRANNILDQIDQGQFTDTDLQKKIKGEALFIRGFCYFQLSWLFGGVPIVDRVMTEQELLQLTRPSVEVTLTFAAQNLITASELLPETSTGKDIGRATKYAAFGLLGRLYLFNKQYDKAKAALEEVIDSENYNLYDDFADCFKNTKDNGEEHVFQIQYTSGLINQGNQLVYTLVPENIRSPLFPNGGRSLWLAVSKDLYESYEEQDIRRDVTIQKGYTTSSGVIDTETLLYVKYAHGDVPGIPEDNDVNLSVLRYTDILLMYAEVLNELEFEANGEALEILNNIRDRGDATLYEATDLTSQEDFREAIFHERRLELACEFLRWFDLVRMDRTRATSILENFVSQVNEGNGTYKFDSKFYLLPIPASERQVNKNLEPNPGY